MTRATRLGCVFGVFAILLPCTPVSAGGLPPVRLIAPVSGAVVGYLTRADGSFAFETDASRDRIACLADTRAVTTQSIRKVLSQSLRDRDAAFIETNRVVAPCMRAKGWVATFCGGANEDACPEEDDESPETREGLR